MSQGAHPEMTSEKPATAQLSRTQSSIRNDKWNLNDHAAGFHDTDNILDIHLGNKHLHSGEVAWYKGGGKEEAGEGKDSVFT